MTRQGDGQFADVPHLDRMSAFADRNRQLGPDAHHCNGDCTLLRAHGQFAGSRPSRERAYDVGPHDRAPFVVLAVVDPERQIRFELDVSGPDRGEVVLDRVLVGSPVAGRDLHAGGWFP